MMHVINGGMHAANRIEFHQFMIVPHGPPSLSRPADISSRPITRAAAVGANIGQAIASRGWDETHRQGIG